MNELNEILKEYGLKAMVRGGLLKFLHIQKDVKEYCPPLISVQLKSNNAYDLLLKGKLSNDYFLRDIKKLIDCLNENEKELRGIEL